MHTSLLSASTLLSSSLLSARWLVFCVSSAISGVMWPHEVFSMMFHLHKEAFFTYIMPGLDVIRNFWNSVKGDCGLSYVLSYVLSLGGLRCIRSMCGTRGVCRLLYKNLHELDMGVDFCTKVYIHWLPCLLYVLVF